MLDTPLRFIHGLVPRFYYPRPMPRSGGKYAAYSHLTGYRLVPTVRTSASTHRQDGGESLAKKL